MLFPNPIARLRKAHYALEDLPDAVTFPKHPARESDAPLPLAFGQALGGNLHYCIGAIGRAPTFADEPRARLSDLNGKLCHCRAAIFRRSIEKLLSYLLFETSYCLANCRLRSPKQVGRA